MKVSRIEIKDFNQFKNIDIDLTYPKGHSKEGQPLDKVCFIGQSGTGKTTLLKIISRIINKHDDATFKYEFGEVSVTIKYFNFIEIKRIKHSEQGSMMFFNIYEEGKERKYYEENIKHIQNEIPLHLIFFPSDLKFEYKDSGTKKIKNKKIINFNKDNVSEVWNDILDEIVHYREKIIRLKNDIADFVTSKDWSLKKEEFEKALNSHDELMKSKHNPLIKLAEDCLDVVLAPFKLRIKRDFEFTKKEDIGFIKIEDFNGNEVPFDLWSTGTKQLLYSTLPLYLLKPENTIILFDEPERSLYPDMQRMIIDYYSSLTKDSQFFYATHSPIIASSFEPWEIIELKLDENGHVYQDIYYEGERHVDNYHIVPQYLSYDKMLRNVFDLDETRNQIGIDKIGDALMYKNHLLKLKKEKRTDTKEFEELYLKYTKLAEQLAWDFNVLDDEKS